MIKRHLYEYIKEFIENFGFTLLSKQYKNNSSELIIMDKEGYVYTTSFAKFRHKNTINNIGRFFKNNPYTIQNIKSWCKLNNKPFELISDMYNGSHDKLKWQCLKEDCGEIFEASWSHIYYNHECGVCNGRQVKLHNCLATKSPELASEWHPTKNGNLTPYDVTFSSGKYAWWKCKECGHEWESSITNRNNRDVQNVIYQKVKI